MKALVNALKHKAGCRHDIDIDMIPATSATAANCGASDNCCSQTAVASLSTEVAASRSRFSQCLRVAQHGIVSTMHAGDWGVMARGGVVSIFALGDVAILAQAEASLRRLLRTSPFNCYAASRVWVSST